MGASAAADVAVRDEPERSRYAPARRLRAPGPSECLRGLPSVFDVKRRPWILRDGAVAEDVMRVVALCPTGALRSHPATLPAENPVVPTEVTSLPGGPLLVRGDLVVRAGDAEERETRAALCSCGITANGPYCDGGGTCADWPRPRRAAG